MTALLEYIDPLLFHKQIDMANIWVVLEPYHGDSP